MKQLTFDRETVRSVTDIVADRLTGFAERQRVRDARRARVAQRKRSPGVIVYRPPAAKQIAFELEDGTAHAP